MKMILSALKRLLGREIAYHATLQKPGSSGHGEDWESGFLAGLQHVRNNLIPKAEEIVRKMKEENPR